MWNLDNYETVEDRLNKFWKEHPNGRIETELLEQSATRFIIKALIYRSESDDKVWATGHAEETVTTKGVNQTSALENCETSAIGRGLANCGYAAKGKRASREEMGKVIRLSAEEIKVENPNDPWTTVTKPMPSEAQESFVDVVQGIVDSAEVIPNCDEHGKPMKLREGIKNNRAFRGYICDVYEGNPMNKTCKAKWQHISKTTGKWVFN